MKRKQAGCFMKQIEEPNGIEIQTIKGPTKTQMGSKYLPGSVSLTQFTDFVTRLHQDNDRLFSKAYKLLRDNSSQFPTKVGESKACSSKNRYADILPFDHSRVKLTSTDGKEGSDYINANYIPGYTSRGEYIATQGPMVATQDDFWRMVWEQNVDVIVMLTSLVEKNINRCDQYWPDVNEQRFYGRLAISTQSESTLSDCTIRIMEMKLKTERRLVQQFCYPNWPYMGCPEDPADLLSFLNAIKQHTGNKRQGPIIVHSSAGVGRTGTFIAVDHLLQHSRDHDEIDIYRLVLEMRQHRCNMVQTQHQFAFIHECIIEYTKSDYEDVVDENGHAYTKLNLTSPSESVYEELAFH